MISSFFCPLVVKTLSSYPKELKERQIPCMRQALYKKVPVYHHVVCLQSVNAFLLLKLSCAFSASSSSIQDKSLVLLSLSGSWPGSLDFLGDPETPSWAVNVHSSLFAVACLLLQQIADEVQCQKWPWVLTFLVN